MKAFIIGLVLVVLAGIAFSIAQLPPWWSPTHALGYCVGSPAQVVTCKSYGLYSGSLSDISEITLLFTAVGAIVGYYLRHQCEHPTCWKWGHPHPEHGRPMCAEHYHHTPEGFIKHHGAPAMWAPARAHLEGQAREHLEAALH